MALTARADVFPYEGVGVGGNNNVVDSNALSCNSVEGCYTRTGSKCSDNPNSLCDLQIVPAGRCTYGLLSPTAGFLTSCVFPHRAGRCTANTRVGCLPDSGVDDTASKMCSSLSPTTCDTSKDKFDRTADPNDAATCTCQGTNASLSTFEVDICKGALSVCSDGDLTRDVGGYGTGLGSEINTSGGLSFAALGPSLTGSSKPDASPPYPIESPPTNFDPQRDAGTIARGSAQGIGPMHQVRGTDAREITAYTHPTIADPNASTSDALSIRKVKTFGDSAMGDWYFASVAVTGSYNTHIVNYTCDPQLGYVVGTPLVPCVDNAPPSTPACSGVEDVPAQYCHQVARNGISFLWGKSLTPAQVSAYTDTTKPVGEQRICPPNCNKDFNLSTTELQEFSEVGAQDPNAGIQLAIQSGEEASGRQAGAKDNLGVAVLTSLVYLTYNDLRCRLGGWGNTGGEIGRCIDGPSACTPTTATICAGEGDSCAACGGPYDATNSDLTNGLPNDKALPVGYNTHGQSVLSIDPATGAQRIAGIAGAIAGVRVPLFLVATSGNAASDFRDKIDDIAYDLNDMGPVDLASAFDSGIGAGGTFPSGTATPLNIAEPCCTGGNAVWQGAQMGTVAAGKANGFKYIYGPTACVQNSAGAYVSGDCTISDWALTYDKGPGTDGIPGCFGDNTASSNGFSACNNRLGSGTTAVSKTNAFYTTGLDDRTIRYTVGASAIPASAPRFLYRDATTSTMATYFPGAGQNPPTVNSVGAFTLRDLHLVDDRTTDTLVKFNVTSCPLTTAGPICSAKCDGIGGDVDLDGICGNSDNCPSVPNPLQEDIGETSAGGVADGIGDACDNCLTVNNPTQADGAVGTEIDPVTLAVSADGVGDACDNCTKVKNPRVYPALAATQTAYLTANPWAILSGGQRDDDHDGYGNLCDADFTTAGVTVGPDDLTQYRAASGKARTNLTACGAAATATPPPQRCSRFDLNELAVTIGPDDLTQYRRMSGKAKGPRCATVCTGATTGPLACASGSAVTCTSPP